MEGTNEDLLAARPRVLVPEKLSPDGIALLQSTLDVDEKKGLSADELLDIIGQYDALLIRSETKVTAALLQAAKKLKVVARAGVGVDNVDVKAATQLGIIVVNSPSGNIGAAAEHTIALLMALARNVPDGCASLKDRKWERSRLVGVEVKGKTLGIIGLGKGWLFFFCNRLLSIPDDYSSFGPSVLISLSRPDRGSPRSWVGNACGSSRSLRFACGGPGCQRQAGLFT